MRYPEGMPAISISIASTEPLKITGPYMIPASDFENELFDRLTTLTQSILRPHQSFKHPLPKDTVGRQGWLR